MTIVKISSLQVMKLLRYAFLRAFETITIIIEKDKFEIIGLDKTSSIAAQINLKLSSLDSFIFSTPVRFPLRTCYFGKYFSYSLRKNIPGKIFTKIDIRNDNMDLYVSSQGFCTLRKTITSSEQGISHLPSLPSFDEEPKSRISDVGLFRLCSVVFIGTKEIVNLKTDSGKVSFISQQGDPLCEIEGEGYGVSSSAFLPYTLDTVSKICDHITIEKLEISILQSGKAKFFYEFEEGSLSYVAAPSSI